MTLRIIKAVGKIIDYSPHTDRNVSMPMTKATQFIEYGEVELVHISRLQSYILGTGGAVHTQNTSRYTVGLCVFAPGLLYICYGFQFNVFIKLLSV